MILKDIVLSASVGLKAFGLSTETQRDAYWRAFEDARQPFYIWAAVLIQRQFRAEAAIVLANQRGESDVSLAWERIAAEWRRTLAGIYRKVIPYFANRAHSALPQKSSAIWMRTKDLTDIWTQAVEEYIAQYVGQQVALILSTTRDLLRQVIQAGIDAGEGAYDISKRIQKIYDGEMTRSRALMIARTEVIGSANYASVEAAKATGLKLEKHWLSTRDNRVRDTHAAADGQVQSMDHAFEVGGAELMFPGDSSLGAPAREIINCFPAETLVWASDVRRAYRRYYEGELIEITTSLGDKLAGTTNHPILTGHGWLPLGSLVEGDRVVCSVCSENVPPIGATPDIQHIPSEIGQIFDALSVSSSAERVAGLHVNFHGDTADGYVDVVASDSELLNGDESVSSDPVAKFGFSSTDLNETALLPCSSVQMPRFGSFPPANSIVRSGSQADPLFGRSICHSEIHTVGFASGSDVGIQEQSPNDVPRNIEVLRDSLFGPTADVQTNRFLSDGLIISGFGESEGFACSSGYPAGFREPAISASEGDAQPVSDVLKTEAGIIQLADVTQVRRISFSGQVYNLETKSGWYSANNIIAHNCRCTVTFAVAG